MVITFESTKIESESIHQLSDGGFQFGPVGDRVEFQAMTSVVTGRCFEEH
jgi:hypothetical protein